MTALFAIEPSDGDGITVRDMSTEAGQLPSGYTSMVPVKVGDSVVLYAHDRSSGTAGIYRLQAEAPFVEATDVKADLSAQAWDSLHTFVLGNEPYLMAYESQHGNFCFYPVKSDLSLAVPYDFLFARNTPTNGFTSVGVYPSVNQIVFTGYQFDTGTVANFTLAVVPVSIGDAPPLLAQNVWYHQWAKGWTHFAFFQLGGSNFFFKINTLKLNVNIDHMQDDPSQGSVEIGSWLQDLLPEAADVTTAAIVPWDTGEPRLLTYVGTSGQATVRRVHADCQGWSTLATFDTISGFTQTVPYRIGNSSFVLFS